MGNGSGMIADYLDKHTKIMEDIRCRDKDGRYVSLKTMIEYEKAHRLINRRDYVSGCRTILRLHRILGKLNVEFSPVI